MKLDVRVDVAESIRRGKVASRDMIIDVHDSDVAALPPEGREILASYVHTHNAPKGADARLSRYLGSGASIEIPEPTLAGVIEGIKADRERAAQEAAEKAERDRKEAAERREKTLAVLRERKTERKTVDRYAKREDGEVVVLNSYSSGFGHGLVSYDWPDWPYHSDADVMASDEAVAWIAECEVAKAAAEAEAGRLAIADLEAKEQAKAAAEAERAAWIEAHGSERLKRCIAEGIECDAIYRDERLAIERPGWQWYERVEGRMVYPRNPPAEAFAVLDEARKFDPKAELAHVVDRDGVYAADAWFLGDRIVYGWPEPEDDDYDDFA